MGKDGHLYMSLTEINNKIQQSTVQEGGLLLGIGIFAGLTALGLVGGIIAGDKRVNAIQKKTKDVFKYFTEIPAKDMKNYINDLMLKYPTVEIDEGVYNQFMQQKELWHKTLKNIEKLMKSEHISFSERYDMILKPFEVMYEFSDKYGGIKNDKEIQKLDKKADSVIAKYKTNHIDSFTLYDNDKYPFSIDYNYTPSNNMISVPITDIIVDLSRINVVDKFNDAAYPYLDVFGEYNDSEGKPLFYHRLYDSIFNSDELDWGKFTTDDANDLFDKHPYVRVYDVLYVRASVMMRYIQVLTGYLTHVSYLAKNMKPIEGAAVQESVFDIARECLQQ